MTDIISSSVLNPEQVSFSDVAGTTDSQRSALTSDFETFLRMLTTQAQNQDPLEPIDSSEYAAQLAQFSMVEQQVQTNEALSSLVSQVNLQNAAGFAAWIGMEVRSSGTVRFEGVPIAISPEYADGTDAAELVVKDDQGLEVARTPITLGQSVATWDGKRLDGSLLPDGNYELSVESFSSGTSIGMTQVEHYGRVTEAQLVGSAVRLVLNNGQTIDASAVSAIRE